MNQLSDKDLELAKKILPCPFCGSDAHHYPDGDMEGYSIMCDSYGKGCPTNTFGYETAEAAEQAWNTRAERDAEQQPNAEAVGEAIGTISSYVITNGEAFAEVVLTGIHLADAGTKIFQGMKLFTHAPREQELLAEIAELRKDAERYRWLNSQYDFLAYITDAQGNKHHRLKCGAALDRFIDQAIAAMQQTDKEVKG